MRRYGYDKEGAAPVAVALHQRAAAQGNVEALLSIGDSYYYGRGVSSGLAESSSGLQAAMAIA